MAQPRRYQSPSCECCVVLDHDAAVPFIDYCLLHVAAPELLAAVQTRRAYVLFLPNPFGHACQWCGGCMDRLFGMESAAIAKATVQP